MKNLPQKITCITATALFMMTAAPPAFAAPSMSQPGEEIAAQDKQEARASVEDTTPITTPQADEVRFTIRHLKLDASELKLNKEDLAKILEDSVDREITLGELNTVVGKLTMYCRQHGYPAAAAYLPAQNSETGTVTIKVIPGRYGEIKLDNQSKLKDSIAKSFTEALKPGAIIRSGKLQTTLYSLSDLSGTRAVGVLSPGKKFGTSDLTVRIENGKDQSTVLYVENYGSRSSGRYRYGLQESIYDLAGTGARLNVGTLISNHDLHNYYVNYEALVGHGGTSLGIGFSRMDYKLGGLLQAWGANGTANTFSLFGSRPIFHHTDKKLRFTYGYNYRDLNDDLDFLGALGKGEKHSHAVHMGLDGYLRAPGQSLDWAFTVTSGTVGMDSYYTQRLADVSQTEGRFTKAEINATGVQALGHSTDVMVKLSGQKASRNLDGSEEFYLGGANGVRAYPQGEASGDEGIMGTLEFRWHTPIKGMTLSSYLDAGNVHLSRGLGGNETLGGWGLGLSYSDPGNWFTRLDYARRIGGDGQPLTANAKARGRTWFILGKIW